MTAPPWARSMSHDLRSDVGDEIGNLPWICHCCYLYYRSCMDDTLLREFLYPLLRRSMNYYFHLLAPGQDGKLHLPKTISPEYGSFRKLKVDIRISITICFCFTGEYRR